MSELLIAIAELLEAEGRDLRRWSFRAGVALLLIGIVGILALCGLGFLIAAVYLFLAQFLGPPWAALLLAVLALILAGGVLWSAFRMIR